MEELRGIAQFLIYGLMGISVIWAICTVTLRNLFHAALTFTGVLLSIAGIYVALRAEFLAVIQVLVYVGAVMTMVIFAIMLTEKLTQKQIKQSNNQSLIGALGIAAFLCLIIKVLVNTPWPIVKNTVRAENNTQAIGEALLTTYVFPFEVIAIFLTAALIGAVVIAKKDTES